MNRETYRNVLAATRREIKDPTEEQVRAICPHLSDAEVSELFAAGSKDGQAVNFAVPPTLVRGWYLQFTLFGGSSKLHMRRSLSGPVVSCWHGTQFAGRALAYAEENWGGSLVNRNWSSVINFMLKDPKQLTSAGRPTIPMVVTVATAKSWSEFGDRTLAPESELIDASIVQITHYRTEMQELCGDKFEHQENNCARCGSGLSCSGCFHCRARYQDLGVDTGWFTPLPRKVAAYAVASGHTFETDPEVASAREREEWSSNPLERRVHTIRV